VLEGHQPSTGATFPVIAGGRLYVRDNDRLFCYDVRRHAEMPSTPRIVTWGLTSSRAPSSVFGFPQVPASAPLPEKKKQPDAIFVPTPHDVVAKMLELAGVAKTDLVYDLGSGDGRIVIAAAKTYGTKSIGIELDKELVAQSQESVKQAGLTDLVHIEHADIFTQDLSRADVIALYLPPPLMDRLLPQLEKLKPGARVVSHYFKFTETPPDKSLRFDSRDDGDVHDVHLWIAPLRKPATS
jgi:protein-L-isoaspartate O-methyltransferase